jgi:hypothetical protein
LRTGRAAARRARRELTQVKTGTQLFVGIYVGILKKLLIKM